MINVFDPFFEKYSDDEYEYFFSQCIMMNQSRQQNYKNEQTDTQNSKSKEQPFRVRERS